MNDSTGNAAAAATPTTNAAAASVAEPAAQSRRQALGSLAGLATVPMFSLDQRDRPDSPTTARSNSGILGTLYQRYIDTGSQQLSVLDQAHKSFTQETGFDEDKYKYYLGLYGADQPHPLTEMRELYKRARKLEEENYNTLQELKVTIAKLCGIDAYSVEWKRTDTPMRSTLVVREGNTIYQPVGDPGDNPFYPQAADLVVFSFDQIVTV